MIKNYVIILISAFLIFSCTAQPAEEVGTEPEAIADEHQELTQKIRDYVESAGLVGVTVSVAKNGVLVFSQGFGYSSIENKVPVDPSKTKFRIGSVSKTLTASAAGKLMAEGKLDLDAPVREYVRSFPEKRYPVTTRLVAGHIAGVRHYRGMEFMSSKHYHSVLEGLNIFKNDPLLSEPGEQFVYSSHAWNLVSAVVESAADQDFLDYMQEAVFDPLDMTNTIADHFDSLIDYRSDYYIVNNGITLNENFVDNSYKWAGGGFLSTSEDLVKYGIAHLGDQYLSREIIEELWTPQKLNNGEMTEYGVGWRSLDKHGKLWVGHGGGSVGGTTSFGMFPEEELVVVVICNVSDARINPIVEDVEKYFLD